MNPRVLLLIGLPALAALALFVLSDAGGGGESPPPVPLDLQASAEQPREEIEPATSIAGTNDRPVPLVSEVQGPAKRDVQLVDLESGLIDGRLQLGAEVLDRMTNYTVWIREQINERSTANQAYTARKNFAVKPGGPQYFAFENIPFSRYGYRIWVTAPRLNGSFQIIRIDEKHPVADVKLTVTKAAPFALRLIDQFKQPLDARTVELYAIDETISLGQPATAETNAYGTAIFEELVAGEYEVVVDELVRGTVRVDPPGFVRDDLQVRHASAILVVPLGASLKVELFDQIGRGVGDVEVLLDRVDTSDNRRVPKTSDYAGIALFENVGPGTYQVSIRDRKYQPTSRRVEIRKSENVTEVTETVKIRLTMAR